jgi:hypothetical protein
MLALAELLFLLAILAVAYVLGAGAAILALRLGGVSLLNHAALLVLGMPLACALIAEATTKFWRHTPGTLGFGGLTVVVPMFIAGVGVVVVIFFARMLFEPFDASMSRDSGNVTPWVVVALLCSVLALALWRYWPEPRARLF